MRCQSPQAILLLAALTLLLAAAAFADVPNRPRAALNEAIAPHATGGSRNYCSIIYYNLCSGWLWTYSGFAAGDEVGVSFDMPADCGMYPGEIVTNYSFWWYWRYTAPGWGYTITYRMYDLDAQLCKVGSPIYVIAGQDPTERWNYYPGFGMCWEPQVAITATYDKGGLPRFATDNNDASYSAPNGCPGFVIGPIHSHYWGGLATQYCPPQYFADNYGAVDCLMDALFDTYLWDSTKQPSSWTAVKSLFR
ncbi:MAG: hypothetical protein EHM19_07805 [Candidatus Latescibacterota bacterium]|nr:MAG: hypothetical protein EHM19_07805 [Candidatus Latescibacterota bacterium]